MKRYFLWAVAVLLILFQLTSVSRDDRSSTFRPPKDWKHNIQYQKIIDAPGVKAGTLSQKAGEWCAKNFQAVPVTVKNEEGAPEATECEAETKTVWKKGSSVEEQSVLFKVTVETIDGRSRVTFSEYRLDHPLPNQKSGSAAGRRNIPMEECLDKEGFPHDNATERFFMKVDEIMKKLLEDAEKKLGG